MATLERPFADGRLALCLSSEAERFPFVDFAQALVDKYKGAVVERVGALGTDEVYWDLRIEDRVLTLHSQRFLGVFLCAADDPSEELLRRLAPFAQEYLRSWERGSVDYWLKSAWRRARALVSSARALPE